MFNIDAKTEIGFTGPVEAPVVVLLGLKAFIVTTFYRDMPLGKVTCCLNNHIYQVRRPWWGGGGGGGSGLDSPTSLSPSSV